MRQAICIAVLLLAALITGCDNIAFPTITIKNNSPIPILVGVHTDGDLSVFSLSAGGSKVLSPKGSDYLVTAAPSDEWSKEVIAARTYLSEKLRKAPTLTEVEIRDLESRLKRLDDKIAPLARPSSPGSRNQCKGETHMPGCGCDLTPRQREEEKADWRDGYAEITQSRDGVLEARCKSLKYGEKP